VSAAAESLPMLSRIQASKPASVWLQRAAAAAVLGAAFGLAAFTVEHQNEFDWHPTLARAQDTLNDAWRSLQSLADSADGPATALPASGAATSALPVPPPPAPPPTEIHKLPAAGVHGATTSAHAVRASGTPATRSTPTGDAEGSDKVAMLSPIASAEADESASGAGAPPQLAFSASSYTVPGTEPAARIVIRRNGSTEGDLNFVWWTEEGSAKADVDYASLGRRIERIPAGSDRITVYVPIISAPLRHEVTQFYVALGEPGSPHSSAPGTRSLVMIDHGS
jgi:hypothetical protein